MFLIKRRTPLFQNMVMENIELGVGIVSVTLSSNLSFRPFGVSKTNGFALVEGVISKLKWPERFIVIPARILRHF